jgi:hypothetical protein
VKLNLPARPDRKNMTINRCKRFLSHQLKSFRINCCLSYRYSQSLFFFIEFLCYVIAYLEHEIKIESFLNAKLKKFTWCEWGGKKWAWNKFFTFSMLDKEEVSFNTVVGIKIKWSWNQKYFLNQFVSIFENDKNFIFDFFLIFNF